MIFQRTIVGWESNAFLEINWQLYQKSCIVSAKNLPKEQDLIEKTFVVREFFETLSRNLSFYGFMNYSREDLWLWTAYWLPITYHCSAITNHRRLQEAGWISDHQSPTTERSPDGSQVFHDTLWHPTPTIRAPTSLPFFPSNSEARNIFPQTHVNKHDTIFYTKYFSR